jgi:Domain of unknown function (DUF4279)
MNDEPENATEGSGHGPAEANYFAYSATLRIFGTIPNLYELSRNLSLVPTHVHRRNDLRHPSSRPDQHDMWIYEPPLKESEPLHRHIDALWSAVRNRKQYLLDLKRTATLDVICGYRSNSDTAGVEVPYQSL